MFLKDKKAPIVQHRSILYRDAGNLLTDIKRHVNNPTHKRASGSAKMQTNLASFFTGRKLETKCQKTIYEVR